MRFFLLLSLTAALSYCRKPAAPGDAGTAGSSTSATVAAAPAPGAAETELVRAWLRKVAVPVTAEEMKGWVIKPSCADPEKARIEFGKPIGRFVLANTEHVAQQPGLTFCSDDFVVLEYDNGKWSLAKLDSGPKLLLDLNQDGQADVLLLRKSEASLPPIENVLLGNSTGQLIEAKYAALGRCIFDGPLDPANVKVTGCNLDIPCTDITEPGAAAEETSRRPGLLRYDCQKREFAVVPGK